VQFDELVNVILEQLKIIAPAVKFAKSGKIFKGNPGEMHAHVYDRIVQRLASLSGVSFQKAEKKFYKMMHQGQFQDGFIDGEGNYHTRAEAFQVAKKYDSRLADADKDLSKRGWKDEDKAMSSEFIPGTRLHPAYA
jgi:hypothetical protein